MDTPKPSYRWLDDPPRRAPARMADTEPVARNSQLSRAVRGFPRDRPIGYTIAPQPARQIWELHRIREESRQQSLISPHFRAFLEWSKCHVLGTEPFGLRFPLMGQEDRERLRDAALAVRDAWRAYQERAIGAQDETLSELCGRTQDWMLVDGDCFVIPFRAGMERRYQGYPGDALAETSHTPATMARAGDGLQRALGVEVNERGRPVRYHFGQRARYLSLGYTSYSSDVDAMPVDASRVWHIRDRRLSGGTVRGWPRIVGAFEYIARLNEFDQAFIRSAIRRASNAIALKRDATMTAGDYDRDGEEPERGLSDVRIEGAGEYMDESVKPYQEAEASAGNILELEPGYEPTDIQTGAPSAQEAMIVERFEHRICKGLGVSLMTLTGDLRGISFSAGQLGLQQDRATAQDLQYIQQRQVIGRVYADWLTDEWPDLLMKWPRLRPDDWRVFAGARHTMPRMPVLEKAKVLAAVEKAFASGLLGYAEARAEAGYAADDIESIIAEWREQRELLGLTGDANGAAEPGDDPEDGPADPDDDDDPDADDD